MPSNMRARKTARNQLNEQGAYKSKLYYSMMGVAEQAAFEAKRRKWKPIEQPPEENMEEVILRNWVAPDVRDFTILMNAFPVTYNLIEEADGTYLFEAVMDDDEFERVRGKLTDHEEALFFEDYVHVRLLHALRRHPEIYDLKPTRHKDQLALFRVLPQAASARPVRLVRLNDIKEYFPFVVWNKDEGAARSTYKITLNDQKVKELSRKAGRNVEPELRASLLDALNASKSWRVTRGVGREVCRIVMA